MEKNFFIQIKYVSTKLKIVIFECSFGNTLYSRFSFFLTYFFLLLLRQCSNKKSNT